MQGTVTVNVACVFFRVMAGSLAGTRIPRQQTATNNEYHTLYCSTKVDIQGEYAAKLKYS